MRLLTRLGLVRFSHYLCLSKTLVMLFPVRSTPTTTCAGVVGGLLGLGIGQHGSLVKDPRNIVAPPAIPSVETRRTALGIAHWLLVLSHSLSHVLRLLLTLTLACVLSVLDLWLG